MGCHFLLQGIFLTQESNPGLLPVRQILYPLSYQGRSSFLLLEENIIIIFIAKNVVALIPKYVFPTSTWERFTFIHFISLTRKAKEAQKAWQFVKKLPALRIQDLGFG